MTAGADGRSVHGDGVGLSTRVFYGFGAVAYGVKSNGFSFFLLLYYNQVLGLPEQRVGLAIMLALLFDALSDPIVGYVSDNLHSRWGRRHPFMYASTVPVAVSYYLLWNPPPALSADSLFVYLLVMAILVRTFITFYEIPSTSLVAELTRDYHERTALLSYRYFFGWWGGLTMAVLAYGVFLQPTEAYPVGVLNPNGYRTYGLAAAAIITLAILVSAVGTHRHIPHLQQPPARRRLDLRRAASEFRETVTNASFLVLFGAAIFAAMAGGLSSALNIYLNTFFWELTSDQISLLVLANFASATIAFGAAPRLSIRMGKKRAAILISLLAVVLAPVPIVLRLVEWFPPNGSAALLPALLVFGTVEVALIIMSSILVASMVADVVEDSEIATGRRSEGVLFAAGSFVGKVVSGVGVFASSLILGWISFPRDASPGQVDPPIVANLGLIYACTLVALYLLSLAFLARYRISQASHEENLETLERRALR